MVVVADKPPGVAVPGLVVAVRPLWCSTSLAVAVGTRESESESDDANKNCAC
jgi:hypothetical protein